MVHVFKRKKLWYLLFTYQISYATLGWGLATLLGASEININPHGKYGWGEGEEEEKQEVCLPLRKKEEEEGGGEMVMTTWWSTREEGYFSPLSWDFIIEPLPSYSHSLSHTHTRV